MNHTWSLVVTRVSDGDSIRGHLARTEPLTHGWAHTIHSTDPNGAPIRLTIVDTPERGHPDWAAAKADLIAWLNSHAGHLCVETYGGAGWDRVLGDIFVTGDRSNTATQHMMMLGWPPYLGVRQ